MIIISHRIIIIRNRKVYKRVINLPVTMNVKFKSLSILTVGIQEMSTMRPRPAVDVPLCKLYEVSKKKMEEYRETEQMEIRVKVPWLCDF